MRLSELLDVDGIILQPPWQTFEDAVRGLIDSLAARGCLAQALVESAVRAVTEREQMASTAIVEIGVAIPHARLAGMAGVAAALAASPGAVYSASGGNPISIMALVLSAPDLAGEHLNVLSMLSMLLQSESVRRQLRSAKDGPSAFAVLRAYEAGA